MPLYPTVYEENVTYKIIKAVVWFTNKYGKCPSMIVVSPKYFHEIMSVTYNDHVICGVSFVLDQQIEGIRIYE